MPKTLNLLISLSFISTSSMFCGCGGGSVALPEAPPPYPNFPVPYQPNNPQGGQVPEAQFNPSFNSQVGSSEFENPYAREVKSETSPTYNTNNFARYTIQANANLWLLVQDPSGNELDWLKMKPGERTPLSHLGPLTLTCSSGEDIEIFDQQGKRVDVPEGNGGLSIVRLQ